MPFAPVTMTLRITSAGSSVEPVNVKRPGPARFYLLPGSIPMAALPRDPSPPKNPAQPFRCPNSTPDPATSGQMSPLSFDNPQAMSLEWKNAFKAKRTLLLQMAIPGEPGERLTVNLSCVDSTQVTVQSASAKVAALSREGAAGDDDRVVKSPDEGYSCSLPGAPRNAAGLGVLTVLGLIFLRRRRQLRAR